MKKVISVIAVCALLSGCEAAEKTAPGAGAASDEGGKATVTSAASPASAGAELLEPFKRDLKQALQAGMAAGPVEAIAVCQVRAPEIAQGLSAGGIRLGRASHRLRNPENTAPNWVAPILDSYVSDPANLVPQEVGLGSARIGYVEPIMLQPMCLACHGDSLAPEVAARIAVLYPDDKATGFKVGDLRGVFWIEFSAKGSQ